MSTDYVKENSKKTYLLNANGRWAFMAIWYERKCQVSALTIVDFKTR